jgi:hypothetical protein
VIAARKKENKDPMEQSRLLTPSELNRGRTSPSSGPVTPDSIVPGGEPGATAVARRLQHSSPSRVPSRGLPKRADVDQLATPAVWSKSVPAGIRPK